MIQPSKAEARARLNGFDMVSFVPMEALGIGRKGLGVTAERAFEEVQSSYTYFADYDVLLAKITPCFENGKLGIASNLTNGIGFGSSEYVVLRPSALLTSEFLYYFLLQDSFRHAGAKRMIGTAGQKRVTRTYIESCFIPIPSLGEQERIVAILDEAFEDIASARCNVKANCLSLGELFNRKLIEVLLGHQEHTKWLRLADIAVDYGRGKSKHRPRNDPKLYGGAYPFIQTGDVRNAQQFINSYSQTYNDQGLAQSKLWPKGTLCITIAANIAETAILDFEACFPDSVIGIVVDKSLAVTSYLEYQLRAAKVRLKARGKGSAQDNINLGTFEEERFFFPPLSIQKLIADSLNSLMSGIDSALEIYRTKLALLDKLKQSLLYQAFSGNL